MPRIKCYVNRAAGLGHIGRPGVADDTSGVVGEGDGHDAERAHQARALDPCGDTAGNAVEGADAQAFVTHNDGHVLALAAARRCDGAEGGNRMLSFNNTG